MICLRDVIGSYQFNFNDDVYLFQPNDPPKGRRDTDDFISPDPIPPVNYDAYTRTATQILPRKMGFRLHTANPRIPPGIHDVAVVLTTFA